MPDGMLRINCEGLLAVAIKDKNPETPDKVDRVDFIFLDPVATLPSTPQKPEAHHPRLEIEDANLIDWSRTSLPAEPNVTPLSFPLTGWKVTVLPNGKAPGGTVELPKERPDPGAGGGLRLLSTKERLLDLKAICGEGTLNPAFLEKHQQVLGTLALETGQFFTMSLNTGVFEKWTFEGSCDEHESADSMALFVKANEFVTFKFTSIADSTKTETVTVKCKQQVSTIKLLHTCREKEGEACKAHKGNHVMQYYTMTTDKPGKMPRPIPPVSESSYCPPARFVEKL